MKYLDEYRDSELSRKYLNLIASEIKGSWSVMEICGGQTHSLVRNGIIDLLPDNISMIHGPGCPVCVTPVEIIDKAIQIAMMPDCILCSFGDMMRVPGTERSLLKAKAEGACVRIVYSPLDAVQLALKNPDKRIVFFAIGFETTAPANALSVIQAEKLGLSNYFLLSSHVLVPPAMEALLQDDETKIDGFLAAGHVCTVMGLEEYYPIARKYQVPIVATGFEPVDLLKGLHSCLKQLEQGRYELINEYARVVHTEGNENAISMVNQVFEVSDRAWRGIGVLGKSGLSLNQRYKSFDADHNFSLEPRKIPVATGCIAGQILKGLKKPMECPEFGNACNPQNPLGAPMVSSEGACAAYYNFAWDPAAAVRG